MVKNGNLDLKSARLHDLDPKHERLSKMSVISEDFHDGEGDPEEGTPCSRPTHVAGTITYRGNSREPLNDPGLSLPHGTEVRFDCVKGTNKDLPGRSWKIVCYNGR